VRVCLAVFDMIGTTVWASDEVPSAFREAFHSVGIDLSDKDLNEIRGRSKREAILHLLGQQRPVPPENTELAGVVYSRFKEALRASLRANARPVPGAQAAIQDLRNAQVQVVLSTGLDRETTRVLLNTLGWESLGLTDLVTGDDVENGRPAPDLIFAAMDLAGVEDSQSVLVVGDTTADLDAAAAACVGWSIGVLGGAHSREELEAHPHAVILESVQMVPGWLRGIGAL